MANGRVTCDGSTLWSFHLPMSWSLVTPSAHHHHHHNHHHNNNNNHHHHHNNNHHHHNHHHHHQPTKQWLAETPAKHPGTVPPTSGLESMNLNISQGGFKNSAPHRPHEHEATNGEFDQLKALKLAE
jgi:hypothetical protein